MMVHQVIEMLAKKAGIKPGTRRMWRVRGRVPYREQVQLIEAARKMGLTLSSGDFIYAKTEKKKDR
jgi:hypothetical protein